MAYVLCIPVCGSICHTTARSTSAFMPRSVMLLLEPMPTYRNRPSSLGQRLGPVMVDPRRQVDELDRRASRLRLAGGVLELHQLVPVGDVPGVADQRQPLRPAEPVGRHRPPP